jgi:hypothetical protein
MKQIMTGPLGRVVYHNGSDVCGGQYPALNVPCRAFARADVLVAANASDALPENLCANNVIQFPRRMRNGAAIAMFGAPKKREN